MKKAAEGASVAQISLVKRQLPAGDGYSLNNLSRGMFLKCGPMN